MSFGTTLFIFAFLPITLLGYYLLPRKLRNFFLFLISIVFYIYGGEKYILVLLFSVIFNFAMGLIFNQLYQRRVLRKAFFIVGIMGNLLPLLYFKYLNFTILNLSNLFHLSLPPNDIGLPLGISFFTFKALTYIIDVYRKKLVATSNILQLGLYISLFPQVVSGPIMPYIDLQDQLQKRQTTMDSFVYGIRRFSYGLAKKVLIADILGQTVNKIFSSAHSSQIDLPTAWLGAIAYTLQIFYDFSGYSDMAVGLGHMLGFTFMENFNYPYISQSITEFWRRWHISLSSWFRNYLYIPLGGNRDGNVYFNLFVVFLVTGIWHGASWTFILWGLWHGLFVIAEKSLLNRDWSLRIPTVIRRVYTLFAVAMGWVLFRSPSLPDALNYFKLLFGTIRTPLPEFTFAFYLNPQILWTLIVAVLLSTPLLQRIGLSLEGRISFFTGRILLTSILLIVGLIFVVSSSYSPFIYFQF